MAQSYQTVPLAQWDWRCLYAFYDALKNSNLPEEKQVDMDYGYVANPTGGFEGLWIFPNQNTPLRTKIKINQFLALYNIIIYSLI